MGAIWTGERVEDCALHVVIDAYSIDTAVKMCDDHVRSSDFLDVARFPTMEHKSGNRRAISGGWADPARCDADGHARYRVPRSGPRAGGENRAACRATTELPSADFTVTWPKMLARGIAAVGHRIMVDLDIQAILKS
ncbi:YceI family protein [Streptomyces sp. NPDC045369]|uniref:YceI family protein n=1 Tax=Streptomyces sp. NPDC045369 TaxID=3155732 RepID=UPI0033C70BB1